MKAGNGFSSDVDTQLKKEAQLESETSRNSFVCLVFDEVKIKEDLYLLMSGMLITAS